MSAAKEPDAAESVLQVDEVDLVDLADKLRSLSEQLQRAAELMHNREDVEEMRERYYHGAEPDQFEQLALDAKSRDEFRRALTTLRDFRRDYGRWERVIAEYALSKLDYTQRDAAKYLGVGVSTVNRWARHPLTVDDHR